MKALILILLAGMTSNAMALIAPWYTYQAELKATVGASACVQVDEPIAPATPGGAFLIKVHACDQATAQGLAVILKNTESSYVAVQVFDNTGASVQPPAIPTGQNPEDFVMQKFEAALHGNPYFVQVHRVDPGSPVIGFVEFKKQVIQVWADNISDLYGNQNYVAQDAFALILAGSFAGTKAKVSLTTTKN